jgi:O-antigen/teichoic acid export membrane protein
MGNLLPQLGGFIFLPIYLQFMSIEDFGVISSMLVIQSIVSIFFSLAMDRSLIVLSFDYKSTNQQAIFFGTNFFAITIISSTFLAILFLTRGSLVKIFPEINFYPYYFYALLIAYLKIFFLVPKAYLQIKNKSIRYISLSAAEFILVTLAIMFFVVYRKEGASGMLKGQLLGISLLFPYLLFIGRKHFILSLKFSMLKKSILFSLPLVPTLLTAFILNLSDRIFIDRYMGLSEVGLYSLAYKIASIVLIVISAINMAVTPFFYRKISELGFVYSSIWIKEFNNSYVKIIGSLVLIFLIFSKEVIFIFFGSSYVESAHIVGLLILSYYFSGTNNVNGRLILYQKKTYYSMAIDMTTALLNIILNFLLIPKYGMTGAALATLASMLFAFIVSYIFVKLYLRVSSVSLRVYIINVLILLVVMLLTNINHDKFILILSLKICILSTILFFRYKRIKEIFENWH